MSRSDNNHPIDRERLEKLLSSMERILDMEEKTILAIDALEARLVEKDQTKMTANELKSIEAKSMELGTRFDTLTDSFNRIDDYMKRNGY